jgi:hypothetical protein
MKERKPCNANDNLHVCPPWGYWGYCTPPAITGNSIEESKSFKKETSFEIFCTLS